MPRYIDADEFMSKFVNEFWSAEISFSSVDDIVEKLVKKAGDVAPVFHAHWTKEDIGTSKIIIFTCSHCGKEALLDDKYCPNCGAKMDEDK